MRLSAIIAGLAFAVCTFRAPACCAVTSARGSVVNADQTVIMLWDETQQVQHFIRQANFKTDAPDVGFIVPSPSRPQLASSGKEAFHLLERITAPQVKTRVSFVPGCSAMPADGTFGSSVRVIEEKRVAGYDATVLTSRSGTDLVAWLKANGYAWSPEVAGWAQPYLGGDWHFTALKVAKEGGADEIRAAALRISFRTARPLFPYREPASTAAAQKLGAPDRLLRLYFISDARYRAEIAGQPWSGKVVWSGNITQHTPELLRLLNIPAANPGAHFWLTEFEDRWPYAPAAGDVYFTRDRSQKRVERSPVFAAKNHDAALTAFLAVAVLRPFSRRRRV